jgi:hypothetical protein
MKLLKFLLVLIPLLSINLSKKKKKKKQNDQKENPLDKRPNGTTPELFCDACIAIIKESTKLLYNKKKESDVIEVLEDICNPQLYYTYSN